MIRLVSEIKLDSPEKDVTTIWTKRYSWKDKTFLISKRRYDVNQEVRYAFCIATNKRRWYEGFNTFTDACNYAKGFLR